MKQRSQSETTVIRPEWVWTSEGLRTDLCVEIRADHIVGLDRAERYPHVDVALPGRLMIPALVNVHSHAFQRAFRGHVQWRAAGRDDFWSWRDRMYAVANGLTPEGVEAVSRLAFLEMAESGIGWVGEFHYLHHQADGTPYADPDELARRVLAAAADVGLRITLLRVAYERNGPGQPLRPDQRRFGDRHPDQVLEAIERLSRHVGPGQDIGLAPHSVRACSAEWLAALATWRRGPVHVHVAEQPAEVEACRAEHARSPVQLLDDVGMLHDRMVAIHLTHPDNDDIERIRRRGAGVGVCPSTELDLGDGFFPLDALDLPMSVGSDSHARIDLLSEARSIELHARACSGRRNVLAPVGAPHGLAERLLGIATTAGRRALGADALGIAVGTPADLLALDLRRVAAAGVPPLEAAAFVATPEWVDSVWVRGTQIVSEGRHPRRDAILDAARPWLG